MSAMQLEVYRKVKNSRQMSGREIEAAALTRCATLLLDCQKKWDAPDRDKRLDQALRTNQRVWSILQSELAEPSNPLPKKLREDLLTLSLFIDNRIIQVMAYPDPGKLKILIDINLNIAAGLNSSPDKKEDVERDQNVMPVPTKRLSQASIRA